MSQKCSEIQFRKTFQTKSCFNFLKFCQKDNITFKARMKLSKNIFNTNRILYGNSYSYNQPLKKSYFPPFFSENIYLFF